MHKESKITLTDILKTYNALRDGGYASKSSVVSRGDVRSFLEHHVGGAYGGKGEIMQAIATQFDGLDPNPAVRANFSKEEEQTFWRHYDIGIKMAQAISVGLDLTSSSQREKAAGLKTQLKQFISKVYPINMAQPDYMTVLEQYNRCRLSENKGSSDSVISRGNLINALIVDSLNNPLHADRDALSGKEFLINSKARKAASRVQNAMVLQIIFEQAAWGDPIYRRLADSAISLIDDQLAHGRAHVDEATNALSRSITEHFPTLSIGSATASGSFDSLLSAMSEGPIRDPGGAVAEAAGSGRARLSGEPLGVFSRIVFHYNRLRDSEEKGEGKELVPKRGDVVKYLKDISGPFLSELGIKDQFSDVVVIQTIANVADKIALFQPLSEDDEMTLALAKQMVHAIGYNHLELHEGARGGSLFSLQKVLDRFKEKFEPADVAIAASTEPRLESAIDDEMNLLFPQKLEKPSLGPLKSSLGPFMKVFNAYDLARHQGQPIQKRGELIDFLPHDLQVLPGNKMANVVVLRTIFEKADQGDSRFQELAKHLIVNIEATLPKTGGEPLIQNLRQRIIEAEAKGPYERLVDVFIAGRTQHRQHQAIFETAANKICDQDNPALLFDGQNAQPVSLLDRGSLLEGLEKMEKVLIGNQKKQAVLAGGRGRNSFFMGRTGHGLGTTGNNNETLLAIARSADFFDTNSAKGAKGMLPTGEERIAKALADNAMVRIYREYYTALDVLYSPQIEASDREAVQHYLDDMHQRLQVAFDPLISQLSEAYEAVNEKLLGVARKLSTEATEEEKKQAVQSLHLTEQERYSYQLCGEMKRVIASGLGPISAGGDDRTLQALWADQKSAAAAAAAAAAAPSSPRRPPPAGSPPEGSPPAGAAAPSSPRRPPPAGSALVEMGPLVGGKRADDLPGGGAPGTGTGTGTV
jgi:hypothetical protein